MTQVQKIVLSASRDIPFNQLVLSQSNVRRIKAGISIEELAEDIARRTLLQSITVRPVLGADGAETGMFEIPAGGRRYRALERLVKQKRLARTAPVPCVVRTDGIAEEDSLAENVQRAPLHPLDQFRAFLALREKGQSEEEIAAAFFVGVQVVRQRLRLASVSPALQEVYAEDGMTLDQLMAFSVGPDHERQDQVWAAVQRSHNKEPYQIRRLLTEGSVRASDKRAQFAGPEYEAAGGAVMRDLFQQDDGGWLQDPGLLDRLVADKIEREAQAIRAEGWKWVEVAADFPYGHTFGLRRVTGEQVALTDEEEAAHASLKAEYEALEETYAALEDLPEDVDQRLGEIETALAGFHSRPVVYEPAEVVRAGAFVSIDTSGALRVERGFVRQEDEPPIEPSEVDEADSTTSEDDEDLGDGEADAAGPIEEDDGLRPIPDRLVTELTAHRTLALRDALAADPDLAFLAALHVLCLKLFYRYGLDSCLEIEAKTVAFSQQASGLADTPSAKSVEARHQAWADQLPEEPGMLWDALAAFDHDSRQALFAHCVSQTLNAVHEAWNRRPKALAHADRLAETLGLDMAAVGWSPTVGNFLGRVTKARILLAVGEAKGEACTGRIDHLKKDAMAIEAERLLAGSGWLPEPLRNRGVAEAGEETEALAPSADDLGEHSAENGGEQAIDANGADDDTAGQTAEPHAVAAE